MHRTDDVWIAFPRIDELLAEKVAKLGVETANIRLYELDNKEASLGVGEFSESSG